MHTRTSTALSTMLPVVALLIPALVQGAEPPPPAVDEAGVPDALREPTIYIPYEKLREVFEREGRGVFLPYEEFQRLWRAARDATPPPRIHRPPVQTLITEVDHEANVTHDVVRVSARVRIDVLTRGWHKIPLGLNDAAITAARIGGEPAHIVFEPAGGYTLLVENDRDDTRRIELALDYAKAYSKAPGRNSVSFLAPRAPVSRWRIRIPEGGVKVDVDPMIAATEIPADARTTSAATPGPVLASAAVDGGTTAPPGVTPAADETVVLAFVGAVPSVHIDWTPRAEGAKGLEALASVTSEQQVRIDEGVVRTRTQLTYTISRAELSTLTIAAPLDHRVVNVFDANVRQWAVEADDDRQRIIVQLFEPATSHQQLVLEFEKFFDDTPHLEVPVPAIQAMGVTRQQGAIAVAVADGRRAEALRHDGLMRLDTAELPAGLAGQTWALAYRYVTTPFELVLGVEAVEAHIVAEELTRCILEPNELQLNHTVFYDIERAGVFRFELDVPTAYEILQVRGAAVPNSATVAVDSYYRLPDTPERVVVNLGRKASGRVGLTLTCRLALARPELVQPLGRSADLELAVPRVASASVQRRSGRLVIYAPEALRVNPGDFKGLRTVSFAEAFAGLGLQDDGRFAGARGVLAFAYAEQPIHLPLQVERRKPHVIVRQLLDATFETATVKYAARLFYHIQYSGVKRLRLDVPEALAQRLRVATAGIREEPISPVPADVPAGYVAWHLIGQKEFLGDAVVEVVWEEPIDPLDVGDSVDIDLPRLVPAGVDRASGQIVLRKAETLDVQATGTPEGIRPIDPQHDLMAGASRAGAARAFEFQGEWALTIAASRYALEEIKTTSIERAVVRMVVTRSAETSVQALYRVRSRRQRLVVRLPAGATFDTEPVRINGQAVVLERGDKGDYSVPLVGRTDEAPFVLELRYTVPTAKLALECPEFPGEPAIQQVYACAYIPDEQAFLGSTGPWTDELGWRWVTPFDRRPVPMHNDRQLISWVTQGLTIQGDPAATFQTDGRLYVFSTLRPESAPAGSLRLWSLDEDWLRLGVFAALVVMGVLLLRKRAATRVVAVGGMVVGGVLLGGFMPTLSAQLINGHFVAAVFVIMVVWAVQYYSFIRPHDPVVVARHAARQASRIARLRRTVAGPPAGPSTPGPTSAAGEAASAVDDQTNEATEGGQGDA